MSEVKNDSVELNTLSNVKDDSHELNTSPIDAELPERSEVQEPYPLSMATRRDQRIIAFHIIYAVDRFDYDLRVNDIVQDIEESFEIVVSKNSFPIQIAEGVIGLRDELDDQLRPLLKNWKLERLGCCTHLILRMALWELAQPDAIPSIIINEAIELAKNFAEEDAYKFINGILDHHCKLYLSDKLSAKVQENNAK